MLKIAWALVEYYSRNSNGQEEGLDSEAFVIEQKEWNSSKHYWLLACQSNKDFFIEQGLSFHRKTCWLQKVKQFFLPETRIPIVLEMGHEAPCSSKSTCQCLSFWFPGTKSRVQFFCKYCKVCQLRAPLKMRNSRNEGRGFL